MPSELDTAILATQYGCLIDPFIYEIDLLPAVLSVTTSGSFVVQSDAAFSICKTTALITSIATPPLSTTLLQPFGSGVDSAFLPFLITMTDQGAGRSLSNSGVPLDSVFGTARKPYSWPTPKVLDQNSSFSVAVQNLSTVSWNVRMSFHGYKIFGNVAAFVSKIKPR
jgi:hypothetical protein